MNGILKRACHRIGAINFTQCDNFMHMVLGVKTLRQPLVVDKKNDGEFKDFLTSIKEENTE
ncbi:MAG: hypothetical protein GY777_02635 [Candidatus Brocadiaceae bacterium]|nr:hypothetical protein [Candidatus Brocadiaceae bacterium]